MALNFPKNPVEGDFFVASINKKFKYTNGAWRLHFNNQPNAEYVLNWDSIQNAPNYVLTVNGNTPDDNGNIIIANSGSSIKIAQGSNTAISLNGIITITHENDSLNKRVISVFENIIAAPVLTPILTTYNTNVIAQPSLPIDGFHPWNAFRTYVAGAFIDVCTFNSSVIGRYVGWDFKEPKKVQAVLFGSRGPEFGPQSFKVQGSYDAVDWFDIANFSPTWSSGAPQLFTFSNNISYSKYRILITGYSNFGNTIVIQGLKFYGPSEGANSIDDSDYSVVTTETTTTITKLTSGTASWIANVILP